MNAGQLRNRKNPNVASIWAGVVAGIAFALPGGIGSHCDAAEYKVTDVYRLPPGAYCFAMGINARGEVVGYATGGAPVPNVLEHGFVCSNGVVSELAALPFFAEWRATWAKAINAKGEVAGHGDPPYWLGVGDRAFLCSGGQVTTFGGGWARANGINDLGEVVGMSSGRVFRYLGGKATDLGTLGGTFGEAYGINDAGQIVGGSSTSSGEHHAFLYSDGRMQDLGTLGGTESSAYAINAAGHIVGSAATSTGEIRAFLYADGQMRDLGTLGGTNSRAVAINTRGYIVGRSSTASGSQHAFLYSNGKMIDLNALIPPDSGWELADANGINDFGQIVGMGYHQMSPPLNNFIAGYLLTPLPVLTNPVLSNGTFRVSMATAPATTYALQYCESLAARNWTSLPAVVGDGRVQEFVDPSGGAGPRFYRVEMR